MRLRLPKPELIGPVACPILSRWTLVQRFGCKLMLHHFHPETEDNPLHDHPWHFISLVLWGNYEDITYGKSEIVKAPAVKYRPALHLHRTKTRTRGAWTLVLALPKTRGWGFWHDDRWWPLEEYMEKIGFRNGCD